MSELVPLKLPPFSPEEVQPLVFSVLNAAQKATWEKERMLRVAFGVKGLCRFRMTVYEQRATMAATLKVVPSHVPGALARREGQAPRAQGEPRTKLATSVRVARVARIAAPKRATPSARSRFTASPWR